MQPDKPIPYYNVDGTSRGFRTIDAARQLVASGLVKPSYGRKGHLKAIWVPQKDGGTPVEMNARGATRYSVLENLDHGRCWKLKRLDRRDDDGALVSARGVFLQVVTDCLVTQ